METQIQGEVVRVVGLERLSSANSAQFKDFVKSRLSPSHRIVEVDLGGVTFVDSEGLGALISVRRTVSELQGRIRLLNPQPMVRQLLDLVQFHRIFDIVP
jgi:anti-anti-sigma factor